MVNKMTVQWMDETVSTVFRSNLQYPFCEHPWRDLFELAVRLALTPLFFWLIIREESD